MLPVIGRRRGTHGRRCGTMSSGMLYSVTMRNEGFNCIHTPLVLIQEHAMVSNFCYFMYKVNYVSINTYMHSNFTVLGKFLTALILPSKEIVQVKAQRAYETTKS